MLPVFVGRIYRKVRFQLAFQFVAGCLRFAQRLPRPGEGIRIACLPAAPRPRRRRRGAAMGKAAAASAQARREMAAGRLAARMRTRRRWLSADMPTWNVTSGWPFTASSIADVRRGAALRRADYRVPCSTDGILRDSMCARTDCLLLFVTVDRRTAIGSAPAEGGLGLDDAGRGGLDDGLDARGDAELVARIVDVEVHRALGQTHDRGNLPGGLATR